MDELAAEFGALDLNSWLESNERAQMADYLPTKFMGLLDEYLPYVQRELNEGAARVEEYQEEEMEYYNKQRRDLPNEEELDANGIFNEMVSNFNHTLRSQLSSDEQVDVIEGLTQYYLSLFNYDSHPAYTLYRDTWGVHDETYIPQDEADEDDELDADEEITQAELDILNKERLDYIEEDNESSKADIEVLISYLSPVELSYRDLIVGTPIGADVDINWRRFAHRLAELLIKWFGTN